MDARRGEKLGWSLGWAGGFAWVAALALVFAIQAKWAVALGGLVIVLLAALAVVRGAPWRHPQTRYWRLMMAPLLLELLAVFWAWHGLAGDRPSGDALTPWMLVWMLPLVLPMFTFGSRRWADGDTRESP
ncbi:hypothetical protein A9O67_08410 [Tepidimonas fonticaldi]|uniref:Uncharacterized protein n=1 Tax=Tepidimonas fonticaldi TaxID=1101373 RepID=A0A1A6DT32_9BURK|nr:hypothetical protein [Tepidimonas fonticaldi]OBS29846.1 hypothetical protein A9O67_08410 [Tepidimonas fonticaldi]